MSVGFIDRAYESVADEAVRLDGLVVPLCLQSVSRIANSMRNPNSNVVLVGNSAADMVNAWPNMQLIRQSVEILADSHEREKRRVRAGMIQAAGAVLLVDDVAVSGTTLAAARDAIRGATSIEALVGLAFKSRRLAKNASMPIRSVITYSQQGGGKLPVNSLSAIADDEDRRREYAARKFGDPGALETIAKIYKQGA